MKRIIGILIALMMMSMVFTGCSGGNDGNSAGSGNGADELKDGVSLNDIVKKIDEEMGIAMGSDVDDTTLTDIFNIDKNDVEEYAGKMSMVMNSADNFIAVKAKDGKADAIKEALEKRKESVMQQFEQYLPDQYVKAQSGKVLVKGDYVFLIILGDTVTEDGGEFDTDAADAAVKNAENIIGSFFK